MNSKIVSIWISTILLWVIFHYQISLLRMREESSLIWMGKYGNRWTSCVGFSHWQFKGTQVSHNGEQPCDDEGNFKEKGCIERGNFSVERGCRGEIKTEGWTSRGYA